MQELRSFEDMMGRKVDIAFPPKRIISLVPSQTELLFDLGLNEEVLGITKFCTHPKEWLGKKTKVGGTKKLNLDTIKELKPDLIIANKEENTQAEIEELAKYFPVWISDIKTIEDACVMIQQVANMVDKKEIAFSLINEIKRGFSAIIPSTQVLSVAYLIWKNPWMTVGDDTFIHDVIHQIGWHNVYDMQQRYPETTIEGLQKLNPDLILLSSEPYPFSAKHINELQGHFPQTKILLVDGEMFSWYGSRLKYAANYLQQLLHSI
jgi:ABC-type Fe3+-hydroxamate transport system substrate-binding protein